MQKSGKTFTAAIVGTVMEWYEFSAYIMMSSIIAPLFFPSLDKEISIIAALATFAVGFLMRPLGAIIFGFLGDRIGRKATLVLSILVMGGASFLIGVIPTYTQIGIFAPIILLILRLLQGLSIGGEIGGGVTYLIEHVPKGNRSFASGILVSGVFMSAVLASVITSGLNHYLSHQELVSWGWRLPFLLSIIITVIGLYIRTKTKETPVFMSLKNNNLISSNPLKLLFSTASNRKLILNVFGIQCMAAVLIYLVFILMPVYVSTYLNYKLSYGLAWNAVSLIFLCLTSIIFGALADYFSPVKTILVGAIIILIAIFPSYKYIIAHPNHFFLIQIFLAVPGGMIFGPLYMLSSAVFSPLFRYTAFSICYNLGVAIFGGTAPLIVALFARKWGIIDFSAYYLMIMTLISIYSLWKLRIRLSVKQ